jgi:hypothetical protein
MIGGGDRAMCDVWLWDGSTEYEGALVKVEGPGFAARLRQAQGGEGAPRRLGRRVPMTVMEQQRQFAGRKFLIHFGGPADASLYEAEIQSVQRSSDGEFDFLVCGRFAPLDARHQELLEKMSIGDAAALFRRRVG